MGRIFDSVEAYRAALDKAVDTCFTSDILVDTIKWQIQEAIVAPIYGYSPEFFNRRGASGGVIDTANMEDSYGGKTLEIKLVADWQNIGFRRTTGAGTYGDLSDVIENSGMYNRPATPFVQIAEDALEGKIDSELQMRLVAMGF